MATFIINIKASEEDAPTTIQQVASVLLPMPVSVFVFKQLIGKIDTPSLSQKWLDGFAASQGCSWRPADDSQELGICLSTTSGEIIHLYYPEPDSVVGCRIHHPSSDVGCRIYFEDNKKFPLKAMTFLIKLSWCGFTHVALSIQSGDGWEPLEIFTDRQSLQEYFRKNKPNEMQASVS